jgi:hypothetical protein
MDEIEIAKAPGFAKLQADLAALVAALAALAKTLERTAV